MIETKWNYDMTQAPIDSRILVYGKPESTRMMTYYEYGVHMAYWDCIDQAWCLDGGTWEGPFITPVAWAPAPVFP